MKADKEKCNFPHEYANLNNDLILMEQKSYNLPSKLTTFDDVWGKKKKKKLLRISFSPD